MRAAIVRYVENERVPLLVLAAAVWLAAAAVGHWALPLAVRARATATEVAQYDSLLAQAGSAELLRRRLSSTNDSLRAILASESGGMARASDLSGMLEMIIERARTADIGFVSVKPQPRVRAGALESYPVLLEFDCAYQPLGRFVAGLEAQPHIARIERLALTARSARSIEVKMLLSVFLQETEQP